MDKYPLQHDRNILHLSGNVNYICHYKNHIRHRYADIAISIRYSNLLRQNRLGFIRANEIHRTPNDCSMDFVLVGIAQGLGYANLTIYMT